MGQQIFAVEDPMTLLPLRNKCDLIPKKLPITGAFGFLAKIFSIEILEIQ